MLQEDIKKINLDLPHEDVVVQVNGLFEKYPGQKDEIRFFLEKILKERTKEICKNVDEISIKVQLYQNADIIPLSYIAKNYFNKTKSWLYQRINENMVNGKPVKFNTSEKTIFNNALQDISKRIGSININ